MMKIFGRAYLWMKTGETAVNGFKTTELFPLTARCFETDLLNVRTAIREI
jgi:hypothetical protein